jgi:16S rRNA processing protein RimM
VIDREIGERDSWENLVVIGRVARAQGRRGEVVVQPASDAVERFRHLTHVFLEGTDEPRYEVSSVRLHKGRPVLGLTGITEIGEAKQLQGKEIRISSDDLAPLPEDVYYHFQLVGSTVVDREQGEIGEVVELLTTGGTDLLVVTRPTGGEVFVPLCADICRHIDPAGKRIDVDAPEGLVELNED